MLTTARGGLPYWTIIRCALRSAGFAGLLHSQPCEEDRGVPFSETLRPLHLIRSGQQVRAWLCAVPSSGFAAISEAARQLLHPTELASWAAMTSGPQRFAFLMGRHAVKRAAVMYLGGARPQEVEVFNGVFGQPLLRFPARDVPHVTLCHTDQLALAVAHPADHVFGIDAEPLDPMRADVLSQVVSVVERERFASAGFHGAEGLFLVWTAKEALSKALRCGLTAPLGVLEVSRCDPVGDGDVCCSFTNFPQYQARCAVVEGHAVALVFPRGTQLGDSLNDLVCATRPGARLGI